MNNKLFKRVISIVAAAAIIISIFPVNYANAAVGDSEANPILYNQSDTKNFPQYPNPGYVRLGKTAEWVLDEDNVAKVTMTLDGKGMPKKTDVVLVIDRSGSMSNNIDIYKYKEVPLTFYSENKISYQYEVFDGWWIFGSYEWRDAASNISISMTAYVDDDGNYFGYKSNSVTVSGVQSSDRNYRMNSSGGTFDSWTNFSNNNCANALINIFSGMKAQAEIGRASKVVTFPSDISKLRNTTNTKLRTVTKLSEAKTAANKFVDALLPAGVTGSLNRIAVVSYSQDATENLGLSNNNSTLKTKINGISATGGTNIQAGIISAQNILSSSNADNKYIIVLSDGEPTYSYQATTTSASNDADRVYNYPPGSILNFKINSFNTGSVKGNGSNYTYSNYNVGGYGINNNGIPTISQALLAKKLGIEIYSVGFDVSGNNDAKFTMEYIASQKDNFYLTTEDLSEVFTNIAGRIAKAGTNSKISGNIAANVEAGYNFKVLTDQAHPISANIGKVTATESSISWELGDITENIATLSYYIKLNVTGGITIPVGTMLDTGGISSVVYKNHDDKWVKQDFPVTSLSAGGGTINASYYLANNLGEPINNEGSVIPFDKRTILEGSTYTESAAIGSRITVKNYAKDFPKYINQSTIASDQNGNKLPAELTATRSTIYLNFPYVFKPSFGITYDGNENTGGSAPIDSKGYYEGDNVMVLGKGTLVKDGYAFNGWSTSKNGAVAYSEGSTFSMGTNTVKLYAVWDKSMHKLTINYILSGLNTHSTYNGDYATGSDYKVDSPAIEGFVTDREVVSGKMPSHSLTENVYYERVKSKLQNNSMYANKNAVPINEGGTLFNIVNGIDYTFGFRFLLGNKDLALNIDTSNNNITLNLDSFKLYDGSNEISGAVSAASSGNKITLTIDKTKVDVNKSYTVTYRVKAAAVDTSSTLTVTGDNMDYGAAVRTITIKTSKMPNIE